LLLSVIGHVERIDDDSPENKDCMHCDETVVDLLKIVPGLAQDLAYFVVYHAKSLYEVDAPELVD
jgi:hypothetical protein